MYHLRFFLIVFNMFPFKPKFFKGFLFAAVQIERITATISHLLVSYFVAYDVK